MQPTTAAAAVMAATSALDDDALFAALYPSLRNLARAVCPPECDPDDLVQDATARALRRGPLHELDHPGAYLRRTIVNLASNERRRLGRRRAALRRLRPVEGSTPEYPSDLAELLALSPECRATLWLADVERRSFDEIAELLGCRPDAARARATRARRQLRHLMEDDR